ARANRAADADFAGALQDRGEHDIHDADAAHQQGDRGDGDHHVGEDRLGALLLREQRGRDGDRKVLHVVVVRIQNRGHHLGGLDAVSGGAQAHVDTVQLVLHILALVPESVLHGIERDVDDVIDIEHGGPGIRRTGHDLLGKHADHLHPRVVYFDELAHRGTVAQEVYLGAFAENAYGRAGGVVAFVEELSLGEMQAVDQAVGRLDAV